MSKILDWVIRVIPQEYKVSVAIKKAAYMVGKCAVALLMYGKMKPMIGDHLSPDQVTQIQTVSATAAAAALEGLHDWAKVKWPQATWL